MVAVLFRTAVRSGLVCLLFSSGAGAAPLSDLSGGQTGAIEYNSTTPGGIYQLVTKAAAPSIVITGTLTFPDNYSGKIPAMVLAHHCNGITASVTNLAAMLRGLGIATFVPDSFTPRGYPNGICTTSATVTHGDATSDALHALKLLATHPSIDPNRIGIIGQSFGVNTVYNTAFQEVRTSIVSGPLKFAAHIALYGGCNIRNWSPNMTGSPMLFLLGGADDWTPPGECLSYGVLLRSLGPQTTTIVYPGAPHAWDSPGAVNYNASRTVYGNCRFQFRLDTLQASRYDTGESLGGTATTSYLNSCKTMGANSGRHDPARDAAYRDITIFLVKNFSLAGANPPASQPDRIFNCAENVFPQLFAPKGSASQTGQGYYYRHYNQTNSYLGTKDGTLYWYAPGVSPNINTVGPEGAYLNQASQAGC